MGFRSIRGLKEYDEAIMRPIRRALFGAALFSAGMVGALLAQSSAPEVIYSPRPLYDAARRLESLFQNVVTYEDPVWMWQGDSIQRGSNENARILIYRLLVLPDDIARGETPKLDAATVGRVVSAYQSQNSGGPQFGVSSSSWGLHIIPLQARDESGRLIPATKLLDARISIPEESRMASEHLKALADSITAVTGVKVVAGSFYFDAYFAANGILPPKGAAQLLSSAEKVPYPFSWGAAAVPARDALIDLLEHSATTLSWKLLCDAGPIDGMRHCVLNLGPISISSTGPDGKPTRRPINYDRLGTDPKRSPPIGPPQ